MTATGIGSGGRFGREAAWQLGTSFATGLRSLFAAAVAVLSGCGQERPLRYQNSVAELERFVRAEDAPTWTVMLKASVLYPARDIVTFDWLWRACFGDEAWNVEAMSAGHSSFHKSRSSEELTAERLSAGACVDPPQPPFAVHKQKGRGVTRGFVGADARGRRYMFKVDAPEFPELGTTAEFVGSRVLWALGYNVPAVHIVTITGTGDAEFDGQRATATEYIEGARGHFEFDWFRYRREVRALRLASAWINDVDRVSTNTLVTEEGGRARYWLIDFNSCLGSWQGRPKDAWRGWRYEWDVGWAIVETLTLRLVRAEPRAEPPVLSPALGRFEAERFDPRTWRTQVPNTAFDHMTTADAAWMIEKIRALDASQIEAIVVAAKLSDPCDARRLTDLLMARRERILASTPSTACRPRECFAQMPATP